ncbi:CaiB/BaiF CoA transferase family protein [Rhodococcus pyridinivorans]|uniref:CaiB/BaiF CoA transferase family protein n=1 Tax=Rhodococcus pyridinivorans TaxID=103816 RepID=UPI000761F293|nr:CaiB/BaiF CoA-transferase family protein [Rhodococcus pyridinivorans]
MTSTEGRATNGPLTGVTVVELASIGPGPWAAMMLADMGAEVIRIDRPAHDGNFVPPKFDITRRGRQSVSLDLRTDDGLAAALRLVEHADILLEGNRPGVTERLGIGPDECLRRNPKLVYGRMTGWGQDGPLSQTAGHDATYLALTGVLHAIGPAGGPPVLPINLVGDYGGGGAFLVIGVLAAYINARSSGKGQVVDAAILDGALSLSAPLHGMLAAGLWKDERGTNLLDSGTPWYDVYSTSDGKHVVMGPLEPKFFDEFAHRIGTSITSKSRNDRANWSALREEWSEAFAAESRDHWQQAFEDTDACVAPVLSLREARNHPHLRARDNFIEIDGVQQPAPAPRFSETPSSVRSGPAPAGAHTREVLSHYGFQDDEIDALLQSNAAYQHTEE